MVPEPGGPGGPLAPPIFGRSVNPIWTGGGQIIPTYYYWPPQYFSPSGITGKSSSWNFSSAALVCILKSGEVLTKSYKTFETNTQIHTVLTVFVLQQVEKWLHLLMDVFAHWYLIYVVWGPTWNDRRLSTKNRKILVRMWTECWKIQVSVLKNEMRP